MNLGSWLKECYLKCMRKIQDCSHGGGASPHFCARQILLCPEIYVYLFVDVHPVNLKMYFPQKL